MSDLEASIEIESASSRWIEGKMSCKVEREH
jgi:hypothetical protein